MVQTFEIKNGNWETGLDMTHTLHY